MSRSNYSDEESYPGQFAMWRGQVLNAIRGRRGQAFLREMIEALDAMPEKRLVSEVLRQDGEVCAIGSVGVRRGIDMELLDPEDAESVAAAFGIARQMVQEIVWINDEEGGSKETPEMRWRRVRAWAEMHVMTEVES